jgi:hypothetical protein
MAVTHEPICYGAVCFVRLWSDEQKFFGFAEYLAAVAVIALAWTTADFRYKFRVATAPIPLEKLTFWVVASIGVLTLLTDLWRAQSWYVLAGPVMTPAEWQALLGAAFLGNFILWVWFAFARPSKFGPSNDRRYANEVYRVLLKGSNTEVPEIADELIRSIPALIADAWVSRDEQPENVDNLKGRQRTRQLAYEVLMMLGNQKFCRHVVKSSPATAMELFAEMREQKRYQTALSAFSRNFTTEVISDRDSFAYHESSGYESGLFGYVKPLTTSIYRNYAAVLGLRSLLDVDYETSRSWKADQWKAYGKLVIAALENFVAVRGPWHYPPEIARAVDLISNIPSGLHRLDGSDDWNSDEIAKLQVATDFAKQFIEALVPLKGNGYQWLRNREGRFSRDVYDLIASLIFELLFSAAKVKGPRDLCWWIQHNIVWSTLVTSATQDNCAAKVVLFKVRRLLFNELKRMETFANFKGTRLLGLMLNVMTFDEKNRLFPSEYPLRKAVLNWTRKNYSRIWHEGNPELGKSTLVDGVTYDEEAHTLIYTRPPLLDRETRRTLFVVDPYVETASNPADNEA